MEHTKWQAKIVAITWANVDPEQCSQCSTRLQELTTHYNTVHIDYQDHRKMAHVMSTDWLYFRSLGAEYRDEALAGGHGRSPRRRVCVGRKFGNNLPIMIGMKANQTTLVVTRIMWIIDSVMAGMMMKIITPAGPYVNTTNHGILSKFHAAIVEWFLDHMNRIENCCCETSGTD